MRKKMKIQLETNMFGTTVKLASEDQVYTLATNREVNLKPLLKTVKTNYWWFRAPTITEKNLGITLQVLENCEHPVQLEVWDTDGKWDASLKVQDQTDAEQVAWQLNGMWDKWSAEEEQSLKEKFKPARPLKVKVNKDGTLRVRGKVTVTQLPNDEN